MTTDAWLAIAHHFALFGVVAVLVAEWTIVRPGMGAADVHRLGRVETAYGAIAALVLAAGVLVQADPGLRARARRQYREVRGWRTCRL